MKDYLIAGLLLVIIASSVLSMFEISTKSKQKQEITSLKAQLKVCQEIPLPKCETLEDRIKWCESKIMHHADALNNLFSRQNGLE